MCMVSSSNSNPVLPCSETTQSWCVSCVLKVCDCLSRHKAQLHALTLARHAEAEEQMQKMGQLQVTPWASCNTLSVALYIPLVLWCHLEYFAVPVVTKSAHLMSWQCPGGCADCFTRMETL